ncbi:nitrite reductase small subunit NirD [Asanoa sp. NPDC049518]|uniref:nitrite reductase small subunit NirD n=1 Tax=unclassified Asanoa TaxID=2685164 RepID=UPI003440D16A
MIVVWTPVCRFTDLLAERGVAALVGDAQVAVFRLHDDGLRAIGNRDPVSGAHVLSRGVVGTRGDRPVVASPMHKQAYDLDTGECLDADARVPVFPIRVRGGVVEVGTA